MKDKIAVVTAAGQGIGRATALSEEKYLLAQTQNWHLATIDFSRFFGSDKANPHHFKYSEFSSDSAREMLDLKGTDRTAF